MEKRDKIYLFHNAKITSKCYNEITAINIPAFAGTAMHQGKNMYKEKSGKDVKNMYTTILFDLDGTITDSGTGILNSVSYALKKYDIEIKDKAELNKFLGPPLQESFTRFCGFSPEETAKAIAYYREYYREKGIYENELYHDIPALLQELSEAGKTIILATSKPELFAVQIMKHFQMDKYFDFIGGATMDGARSKKADVIAYALEQCHITDISSAVMVGDREQDIFGAKEMGIDSIGVLYGYGSREELQGAGATYIAQNVRDIMKLIN